MLSEGGLIYNPSKLLGARVMAAAVNFDDERTVSADGRALEMKRTERNRTAISLAKMGQRLGLPMLLGWIGLS